MKAIKRFIKHILFGYANEPRNIKWGLLRGQRFVVDPGWFYADYPAERQ